MLEIWRSLRVTNDLCTQIPASFTKFDPQAFIQNFRQKQQREEEDKRSKANNLSSIESNYQRSELDNLLSSDAENAQDSIDESKEEEAPLEKKLSGAQKNKIKLKAVKSDQISTVRENYNLSFARSSEQSQELEPAAKITIMR